ncbi:MAG: HAMP domain-containing histidine kinase [candidate division WOR-3 bacterium]|nr:MAG: HAMP domain-containing histidine kinase [candidate division WOR-3 bacterium]
MKSRASYPRDIGAIAIIFIVLILLVAIINLYISFQFRNEFVSYGRSNILAISNVCRDYLRSGYDRSELSALFKGLSRAFNLDHLVIADTLGNRVYDSWTHFGIMGTSNRFEFPGGFERVPDVQELVQKENEFLYRSADPPVYIYVSLIPAYSLIFGNIFRWHIFYITISLVFTGFLGFFLIRNLFLPMRYVANLARDFGIEMKREDFVSTTFNEVYRKLKLREQMLVEFSAYIAHEFRNSLGAIIGLARLVEKGKKPASDIVKECRNMEQLITRILEYSKPLSLNITGVNLNKVLDEAMERVSMPKRISIARKGASDISQIQGDHELLAVAITNLLKNAKEAIKNKGHIEICLGREGEFVVLSIADSGVGVEERELDMIFNPFYSRKADGMGLGLAYVKKIVEEHGGRINVTSRKGKGTAFNLAFRVYGR